MRTPLPILDERELALVSGGTSKGTTPKLNGPQASAGPIVRTVIEVTKVIVKEAGKTVAAQVVVDATKKGAQAVKNHQFHANSTPVANRTHRWLH